MYVCHPCHQNPAIGSACASETAHRIPAHGKLCIRNHRELRRGQQCLCYQCLQNQQHPCRNDDSVHATHASTSQSERTHARTMTSLQSSICTGFEVLLVSEAPSVGFRINRSWFRNQPFCLINRLGFRINRVGFRFMCAAPALDGSGNCRIILAPYRAGCMARAEVEWTSIFGCRHRAAF